jgi:hypothetical protein
MQRVPELYDSALTIGTLAQFFRYERWSARSNARLDTMPDLVNRVVGEQGLHHERTG